MTSCTTSLSVDGHGIDVGQTGSDPLPIANAGLSGIGGVKVHWETLPARFLHAPRLPPSEPGFVGV